MTDDSRSPTSPGSSPGKEEYATAEDPLRILFVADGTLDHPLLHSQGIPLLVRLSLLGHRVFVLSFEPSPDARPAELRALLQQHGIEWTAVTAQAGASHAHRVYMISAGLVAARRICRRQRIDIVHTRSYRPAVMGAGLRALTGVGFLFDMRGFMIDERVADGAWRAGSLKYRLAKRVERACLRAADVVITTSPQFRDCLLALDGLEGRVSPERVLSIPNCADLARFRFDDGARRRLRQAHGWQDRFVFAFAGNMNRYGETMDLVLGFFAAARRHDPRACLALFVTGERAAIESRMAGAGFPRSDWTAMQVPPALMAAHLSAADAGLSFFKVRNFANAVASPIKFAEYLACGLPVVINPGVGETGRIVQQYRVGVVVDPGDPVATGEAAACILGMGRDDPDLRSRCRAAAEQELSLDHAVERYLEAYRLVMARRRG